MSPSNGMTLAQWAEQWPYKVYHWNEDNAWTSDATHSARVTAWHLDDYFVSAVTAGSIWFYKRESRKEPEVL